MKKQALCLAGIMLLVIAEVKSQTIVSAKDGNWSSSSTWSGGIVPDGASEVQINHRITIPADTSLLLDSANVSGFLIAEEGATVSLLRGLNINSSGSLQVYGTIVCNDGAALTGTTVDNTTFFNGSVYRHLSSTEGVIPLATWEEDATFEIRGFSAISGVSSSNWSQVFGTIIYDCPNQGAFVEFKGLLRTLTGDLIVNSTGNGILRLAQTQSPSISIGGDVLIDGSSQVWFGMSGNSTLISVGGDFTYNSTKSTYFATTGQSTVIIHGNFYMNSGTLKLASRTASGHTDLVVKGNFNFQATGEEDAIIDAIATGSGTIIFDGETEQTFNRGNGSLIEGDISFVIESGSIVNLGESVLSNTEGGSLQVKGTLQVGSTDVNGAIQSAGGNIQIVGDIIFDPGSVVEYNGNSHQYIGDVHPSSASATTKVSNESGVTLLNNITCGNLEVDAGTLDAGIHTLWVNGNISCSEQAVLVTSGEIVLNGTGLQTIDAAGNTFHNLTIQKDDGTNVQLLNDLHITGILSFNSSNSDFISNGFLTLTSVSKNSNGTASIGPLGNGNAVIGDVTVERHIDNIGRKYRYISSSVSNATVASLMDDFSVTGVFSNPSTGVGINTNAPSLYYYNEEGGAWAPYPITGNADQNLLEPGRGYSAFIWEGNNPVLWDVTGEVNQGEMNLPVTYTTTGNESSDGWNLVGNPYPCAIQWTGSEGGGWFLQNVHESIAVRDNESGSFRYSDGQVGDLTGGHIAAGQAFWVKTTSEDPVLRVNESAKMTGGAEFYRTSQEIDFIEISLTRESVVDKAYFRLRKGSKMGYDRFDIPKRNNDLLTLSISDNSINLAISAVDSVACYLELPLYISSVSLSGALTFSVQAHGLFQASSITIYDKLMDREFETSESFAVDSADHISDRFIVRIRSELKEDIAIDLPSYVCNNDTLQVKLTGAANGVRYFLKDDHGTTLALSSGVHEQIIPASHLNPANNLLTLWGKNVCIQKPLIDSVKVERLQIDVPFSEDVYRCQDGPVTFQASGAPSDDYLYKWYDSRDATDPVGTGNPYQTSSLSNSQSYYVSMMHQSSGCESQRRKITAEVIQYEDASITFSDGRLVSSYDTGNQWYFNGTLLTGEINPSITPVQEGVYRVEVDLGKCVSDAEYKYIIANLKSDEHVGFKTPYPNPAAERLFLPVLRGINEVTLLDILSTNGTSVMYLCALETCDSRVCAVNIKRLPAGVYIVKFKDRQGVNNFRFIKM